MKPAKPTGASLTSCHVLRVIATGLAIALGLPPPAFALRQVNAGMEESPTRRALQRELLNASGLPSQRTVPDPRRTGMEERPLRPLGEFHHGWSDVSAMAVNHHGVVAVAGKQSSGDKGVELWRPSPEGYGLLTRLWRVDASDLFSCDLLFAAVEVTPPDRYKLPKGRVRLWELATDQVRKRAEHGPFELGEPAMIFPSADGGVLTIVHLFGKVSVLDIKQGKASEPYRVPRLSSAFAVSPDGWAAANWNPEARTVDVIDLQRAERVSLAPFDPGDTTSRVFALAIGPLSPEYRRPLLLITGRTVQVWQVPWGEGGGQPPTAPIATRAFPDQPERLAWDPLGRIFAVWTSAQGRSQVRLWDVHRGFDDPIFTSPLSFLGAGQFSPDGRWFLAFPDDGVAQLWDLKDPARPTRRTTLTFGGKKKASAAFSQDGRILAFGDPGGRVSVYELARSERDFRGLVRGVRLLEDDELLVSAVEGWASYQPGMTLMPFAWQLAHFLSVSRGLSGNASMGGLFRRFGLNPESAEDVRQVAGVAAVMAVRAVGDRVLDVLPARLGENLTVSVRDPQHTIPQMHSDLPIAEQLNWLKTAMGANPTSYVAAETRQERLPEQAPGDPPYQMDVTLTFHPGVPDGLPIEDAIRIMPGLQAALTRLARREKIARTALDRALGLAEGRSPDGFFVDDLFQWLRDQTRGDLLEIYDFTRAQWVTRTTGDRVVIKTGIIIPYKRPSRGPEDLEASYGVYLYQAWDRGEEGDVLRIHADPITRPISTERSGAKARGAAAQRTGMEEPAGEDAARQAAVVEAVRKAGSEQEAFFVMMSGSARGRLAGLEDALRALQQAPNVRFIEVPAEATQAELLDAVLPLMSEQSPAALLVGLEEGDAVIRQVYQLLQRIPAVRIVSRKWSDFLAILTQIKRYLEGLDLQAPAQQIHDFFGARDWQAAA